MQIKHGWLSDRWLWFEILIDGILIWDAEITPSEELPESIYDFHKYILGMVRYDDVRKLVERFELR
jgi:hypothetical protein